jgi:hypothetical protein
MELPIMNYRVADRLFVRNWPQPRASDPLWGFAYALMEMFFYQVHPQLGLAAQDLYGMVDADD